MTRAAAAWGRFWLAEEPASTLVLVRAAFALVVLAWAATLAPDVQVFHGADGIAPGSRLAAPALAALAAAAACLLVGYRPRLAAVVVLGCLLWLSRLGAPVGNSGRPAAPEPRPRPRARAGGAVPPRAAAARLRPPPDPAPGERHVPRRRRLEAPG